MVSMSGLYTPSRATVEVPVLPCRRKPLTEPTVASKKCLSDMLIRSRTRVVPRATNSELPK